MSKMIVFHGLSGVGKSEACRYLEKYMPGVYDLHPIAFLKHSLEKHYDLPKGALDTPEGKAHKAPGANSNMGEIMIDIYHFWLKHDPEYSTRKLRQDLPKLLKSYNCVVMQAIRNVAEAQVIADLIKQHELIYVWLSKPDVKTGLSSDSKVFEIEDILTEVAKRTIIIENNFDLEYLYARVADIYNSFVLPELTNIEGNIF